MDVTPAIRTAERRISSRDYQDYLKTPRWRKVRDAALRLANFRCSACPSKRELHVHHLTYDRLGNERDEDLRVLCKACHSGEHFNQLQDELGIYTKLASEALRKGADRPSEIREIMRELCIQHRIAYVVWKVDAAISRVSVNRLPLIGAPARAARYEPAPDGKDATPAEAAGLLARIYQHLGSEFGPKVMASVTQTKAEAQAQADKLHEQSVALRASIPQPKRKPFAERLEEIFTEQPW